MRTKQYQCAKCGSVFVSNVHTSQEADMQDMAELEAKLVEALLKVARTPDLERRDSLDDAGAIKPVS